VRRLSPDRRGAVPQTSSIGRRSTTVGTRTPARVKITSMERNVQALLVAYHREGDERARDEVLVELMPLVRALASRYVGRGESLEDLVQVGSIGLIKAVDRFDVDRGVDISSYAVPTIVGEIRRHFRDKAWAMHVPRRLKELSVRLSRVLDELTNELGRSPTVAELAAAVGEEEEDVIDALDSTNAYSTRSLQAPFEEGGDDFLADKLGTEDAGFEEVEDSALVEAGLQALDERERQIVELRFFKEMTQSQIAAEIGISQMHVSRLLRRALATMRGRIDEVSSDE
jgi:RNA polymerase sigma-B factor